MAVDTVSVVIKVPKKLQGKVIGKRGATIKDIESDYPGVNVVVPKRDSDSEDVVVQGPPDAVRHAQLRILDICGMSKDNSSQARGDAQALFDEADKLFKAAKTATSKQEKDRLYKLAHAKKAEAHTANKEAAKKIFKVKNSGYGNDQMDLHGLQVKEAVEYVTHRLTLVDADLRSKKLPSLTIITGAGNHSENNRAKIKPEIETLLRKGGYPFIEEEGQLIVSFADISTTPQQQPRPPRPAERPPAEQETNILSLLFSCLVSLCALGTQSQNQAQETNKNRSAPSQQQQPKQPDMERGNDVQKQKSNQGQGTTIQHS